eukprot:gene9993-6975_t
MEEAPVTALRIKDGIFVGNQAAASDRDLLHLNKITHVLNCAGDEIPNYFEGDGEFRYLSFPWCDNSMPGGSSSASEAARKSVMFDPENNNLKATIAFIDDAVAGGECVMVHSRLGVSRAPALLAGYLVVKYGWRPCNALNFLRRAHPTMAIQPQFLSQVHALAMRFPVHADVFDEAVDEAQFGLDNDQWMLRNTLLNCLPHQEQEHHDLFQLCKERVDVGVEVADEDAGHLSDGGEEGSQVAAAESTPSRRGGSLGRSSTAQDTAAKRKTLSRNASISSAHHSGGTKPGRSGRIIFIDTMQGTRVDAPHSSPVLPGKGQKAFSAGAGPSFLAGSRRKAASPATPLPAVSGFVGAGGIAALQHARMQEAEAAAENENGLLPEDDAAAAGDWPPPVSLVYLSELVEDFVLPPGLSSTLPEPHEDDPNAFRSRNMSCNSAWSQSSGASTARSILRRRCRSPCTNRLLSDPAAHPKGKADPFELSAIPAPQSLVPITHPLLGERGRTTPSRSPSSDTADGGALRRTSGGGPYPASTTGAHWDPAAPSPHPHAPVPHQRAGSAAESESITPITPPPTPTFLVDVPFSSRPITLVSKEGPAGTGASRRTSTSLSSRSPSIGEERKTFTTVAAGHQHSPPHPHPAPTTASASDTAQVPSAQAPAASAVPALPLHQVEPNLEVGRQSNASPTPRTPLPPASASTTIKKKAPTAPSATSAAPAKRSPYAALSSSAKARKGSPLPVDKNNKAPTPQQPRVRVRSSSARGSGNAAGGSSMTLISSPRPAIGGLRATTRTASQRSEDAAGGSASRLPAESRRGIRSSSASSAARSSSTHSQPPPPTRTRAAQPSLSTAPRLSSFHRTVITPHRAAPPAAAGGSAGLLSTPRKRSDSVHSRSSVGSAARGSGELPTATPTSPARLRHTVLPHSSVHGTNSVASASLNSTPVKDARAEEESPALAAKKKRKGPVISAAAGSTRGAVLPQQHVVSITRLAPPPSTSAAAAGSGRPSPAPASVGESMIVTSRKSTATVNRGSSQTINSKRKKKENEKLYLVTRISPLSFGFSTPLKAP